MRTSRKLFSGWTPDGRFLRVPGDTSNQFRALEVLTLFIGRTPAMKDIERYEEHLMRLEPAIAERRWEHVYFPTSEGVFQESGC